MDTLRPVCVGFPRKCKSILYRHVRLHLYVKQIRSRRPTASSGAWELFRQYKVRCIGLCRAMWCFFISSRCHEHCVWNRTPPARSRPLVRAGYNYFSVHTRGSHLSILVTASINHSMCMDLVLIVCFFGVVVIRILLELRDRWMNRWKFYTDSSVT